MVVLIKIIQLVLALSILVIVHEFGHFITARIFKTRVEKFYIFFNPNFSLFRCKKVHGKWRFAFFCKNVPEKYITHERINPDTNKKETTYEEIDLSTLPIDDWRTDEDTTEFGIGWIPLGGYCKIAGMIDESMDLEQMKKPAQPWEFRSKPAWQRLIVMVGGVVMNVITAYIIYTGLLISQGSQYLPTSEVNKYGIHVSELAREFGFRECDKILSIDGKYIEDFSQVQMEILLESPEYIEVERDGEKVRVELPEDAVAKLVNSKSTLISYHIPFEILEVAQGSIAEKAGMQKGDKLIKINETIAPHYNDFVNKMSQCANQNVDITLVRNNDTLNLNVQLSDDAKLGVFVARPAFELKTQQYTFLQAIPAGFKQTGKELSDYWKQLKLIFQPSTKAYESLGGFITIGSIFPSTFDWIYFWRITAFISIVLAVMNILPIPALDGGHVLFLLYEIITRRKPNDKFMEIAQTVGLFILLALLIFANGNDILRLFR